jgi:hypothetical protein
MKRYCYFVSYSFFIREGSNGIGFVEIQSDLKITHIQQVERIADTIRGTLIQDTPNVTKVIVQSFQLLRIETQGE